MAEVERRKVTCPDCGRSHTCIPTPVRSTVVGNQPWPVNAASAPDNWIPRAGDSVVVVADTTGSNFGRAVPLGRGTEAVTVQVKDMGNDRFRAWLELPDGREAWVSVRALQPLASPDTDTDNREEQL